MDALVLEHIYKSYPKNITAVRDVSFCVKPGECIVIVGPSGSGKTTLLRIIAGLEKQDSGDVCMQGEIINEVHASQRNLAMVFQSAALFDGMRVYDNIAFGMSKKGYSVTQIQEKIAYAAEQLQIKHLLKRYPTQLSGGEKQRVSLARAMIRDAKLLLLDEPLSSLDAQLRLQLQTSLLQLHETLHNTMLYVTHDQVEAMSLATRIVVMNQGEVVQIGTPQEIYAQPNCLFVASFIGERPMNFVEGRVLHACFVGKQDAFALPASDVWESVEGKKIIVGIRPEDCTINGEGLQIHCSYEMMEMLGQRYVVHGLYEGQSFAVYADEKPSHIDMLIAMNSNKMHYFDMETKQRISL